MLTEVVDPLQLPVWMDLTAIVVGALAGATFAVRLQFDVIGVLIMAIIVGLGGGIVRDVLLGLRPAAITDRAYLPTAVAAAVIGLLFASLVNRLESVLTVMDAAALALFTIVGVEKTLVYGLGGAAAMFVGVTAAVGGGVLRDVVSDQPVQVVRRGPWNAAAALAGAGAYVAVDTMGAAPGWSEAVCLVVVTGARLASVYLRWETATAATVDLTPAVVRPIRGSVRRLRFPRRRA